MRELDPPPEHDSPQPEAAAEKETARDTDHEPVRQEIPCCPQEASWVWERDAPAEWIHEHAADVGHTMTPTQQSEVDLADHWTSTFSSDEIREHLQEEGQLPIPEQQYLDQNDLTAKTVNWAEIRGRESEARAETVLQDAQFDVIYSHTHQQGIDLMAQRDELFYVVEVKTEDTHLDTTRDGMQMSHSWISNRVSELDPAVQEAIADHQYVPIVARVDANNEVNFSYAQENEDGTITELSLLSTADTTSEQFATELQSQIQSRGAWEFPESSESDSLHTETSSWETTAATTDSGTETDAFDTGTEAEAENDGFDAGAEAEVETDTFDAGAEAEVETEAFDTGTEAEAENDGFDAAAEAGTEAGASDAATEGTAGEDASSDAAGAAADGAGADGAD